MKQGKDVQDRIMCFEFPIILDDMRFRIEIMLQSYEELYPERQREMKLSEKEITALRNEAMSRIEVSIIPEEKSIEDSK